MLFPTSARNLLDEMEATDTITFILHLPAIAVTDWREWSSAWTNPSTLGVWFRIQVQVPLRNAHPRVRLNMWALTALNILPSARTTSIDSLSHNTVFALEKVELRQWVRLVTGILILTAICL